MLLWALMQAHALLAGLLRLEVLRGLLGQVEADAAGGHTSPLFDEVVTGTLGARLYAGTCGRLRDMCTYKNESALNEIRSMPSSPQPNL